MVATRALVDTLTEQEALEALLEGSKPPVPPDAARLDYLLYTPFRYPPPHQGSRFRGLHEPGVWYGADAVRTGCAELGYWRWRFLTASHGLERLDGVPHTVFQALARGATIDLRTGPFDVDRGDWTDSDDYAACQSLARSARAGGVAIIRYESVRDPAHGGCGAVLTPAAFSRGRVRRRQTWFLSVDRARASWVRAQPHAGEAYEFTFA